MACFQKAQKRLEVLTETVAAVKAILAEEKTKTKPKTNNCVFSEHHHLPGIKFKFSLQLSKLAISCRTHLSMAGFLMCDLISLCLTGKTG